MFHTDYMQFYPTPLELGKLAWSKFQNRNFVGASDFPVDNGTEKLHPDKMGFGLFGGRAVLRANVRHLRT